MDEIFGFDFDRQWDYENGFYLTSPVNRMGKLLAHYELYKSITTLPGAVVECGVYKGASLVRFASFRELLESPDSRRIIGFDAFGAFPMPPEADDRAFAEHFENQGGHGIEVDQMREILNRKRLRNCDLIPGDILQTVPDYVASHPELKIALLHIDVDVYAPTKVILEELFDRVVPGGLVVFDDYATVAGETRAVDEFLQQRQAAGLKPLRIEKLPISHIPAYIRFLN